MEAVSVVWPLIQLTPAAAPQQQAQAIAVTKAAIIPMNVQLDLPAGKITVETRSTQLTRLVQT